MRFVVLALILLYNSIGHCQDNLDDLLLDTYYIEIKPEFLDALYASPYSDTYYPATISFNSKKTDCEVRFRGASSRNLPKKSWKIKFPNNSNPYNVEKLNFNAEYRDLTLLRNYLTMKLFDFLNEPASPVFRVGHPFLANCQHGF